MFKIKGTKNQGCSYYDKCKLVNKLYSKTSSNKTYLEQIHILNLFYNNKIEENVKYENNKLKNTYRESINKDDMAFQEKEMKKIIHS